jgi:hypothetical protein
LELIVANLPRETIQSGAVMTLIRSVAGTEHLKSARRGLPGSFAIIHDHTIASGVRASSFSRPNAGACGAFLGKGASAGLPCGVGSSGTKRADGLLREMAARLLRSKYFGETDARNMEFGVSRQHQITLTAKVRTSPFVTRLMALKDM